jgi:hypothetical protein
MPKLQRELLQYRPIPINAAEIGIFFRHAIVRQDTSPPTRPKYLHFYALCEKLLKTYETGKNYTLLQALHGTASAETDRFLCFQVCSVR